MQYNLSDPAVRVELLQRMLRYLSYTPGREGLRVSVDGVYNEETRQAVRYFQQTEHIPVTGVVDRETWEEIAAQYAAEQALREPIGIRIIPNVIGERSDDVLILQVILGALRREYPYPPVPLSGVYGSQTADAVREFQRISGMEPTGQADRLTWLRLSDEYRRLTDQ